MLEDSKKNGVMTQMINRLLTIEEWIRKHKMLNHPASSSSGDGWIPVSDTWAYASASTITVPTDATTRYRKGMRIRFKQGGSYKYYVPSVVAATLITVIVNTDYTVANSPITDIAYSYLDNPSGWPAYFNYTPSLAPNAGAFTLAAVTGTYTTSNAICTFWTILTITTNGTASGYTKIGLPVISSALASAGCGVETAATGFVAKVYILASSLVFYMTKYDNTYLGGNGYVIISTGSYAF